jgi:hypothetical protein
MVWADGLWFLGGQFFCSDAFFSLQKVINTFVLVKLLQFSGIVKITTHDLFKSVMSFTRSDGCAVLFYRKLLYLLELAKATQTKQKRVIIA